MFVIHLIVGLMQLMRLETEEKNRKYNLLSENIGLMVELILYQGLIFSEAIFFLYKIVPIKGMAKAEEGFFSTMDSWDMLILFDIGFFFSQILTISFMVIMATATDEEAIIFKELKDGDNKTVHDFLEEKNDQKKLVVYMN